MAQWVAVLISDHGASGDSTRSRIGVLKIRAVLACAILSLIDFLFSFPIFYIFPSKIRSIQQANWKPKCSLQKRAESLNPSTFFQNKYVFVVTLL